MTEVILFNKPYGVHSQFRKDNPQMSTLADYFHDKNLRVAGRLDKDSEGLLILTDNGALNHAITTPAKQNAINTDKTHMGKSYLVQVENIANDEQIHALRTGVMLKDGQTLPAQVQALTEDELPITLWERSTPIRKRQSIPTSWLSITIFEGKNRQVRRMVAHVGLPCLRLIRYRVGRWTLGDLAVGQWQRLQLSDQQLSALLIAQPKTKSTATFKPHKPSHKSQPKNRQYRPKPV